MRLNKFLIVGIFTIFMLLPTVDIYAQCFPNLTTCCDNPTLPTCGGCPPCVPVPLDGGLSALLLAGIAYGAKKVHGKTKI